MATVSGNDIIVYQGETLDIQFDVVDADGVAYDLSGGAAVLTYQRGTGAGVDVVGVIDVTTVTVLFAHSVTKAMSGTYAFQLMCRNPLGKIVMTREGFLLVKTSLNADAVSLA